MAIPHFRGRIISGGRSPVGVAAYIHRTTMKDYSIAAEFRNGADPALVHSEIALPSNASPWLVTLLAGLDTADQSQRLWNAVTSREKRFDAQTAREFIIALPIELTRAQNIELMRNFVAGHMTPRGFVVDWAFHDEPGNPHVHLMHTLRPVVADGFGNKRTPVLDENGAVVRDKSSNRVSTQFIGNRSTLVDLRTAWAHTATRHLASAGHDVVLDLRSFAARGIRLTPTTHIGPAGTKFARADALSRSAAAAADAKAATTDQILHDPGSVVKLVASKASVFDRRDIAMALHTFIDDAPTFSRALTAALAHPSLVELRAELGRPNDPHYAPARLTTASQIALEQAMSDQAHEIAARSRFRVNASVIGLAVLEAATPLSEEQKAAVAHIVGGADLTSIVGFAGAGKTTLLRTAVEAWTSAGYKVRGASLASKAARGLADGAGIEARTIAYWRTAWANGRAPLTNRDILIVDEAGMASSADLALLTAAVAEAGAKLVLIGDPEQLQPIAAGGAFRAIIASCGSFELASVFRQNAAWARQATVNFQRGQVREALVAYRDRGCVIETADREEALERLVGDYLATLAASPAASIVALAHRNDDILAINLAIQAARRPAGAIGPEYAVQTARGNRTFAAGDRIVILKNTTIAGVGVSNSDTGVITAVSGPPGAPVFAVAFGDGRAVDLDTAAFREFDLGYATTIHKAQGATVDHAFVLASATMDKYLAYVAASRHRVGLGLYTPKTEFATFDALVWSFSRTSPKETTLDYGARRGLASPPALPPEFVHLMSRSIDIIGQLRSFVTDVWASVNKSVKRTGSVVRPDATRPAVTQGTPIMDLTKFPNIDVKPSVTPAGKTMLLATWRKDTEANAIAKDYGARWSNEDKSWSFSPLDPRTTLAFERINTRIDAITKATALAAQVSPPAAVAATVVDHKVHVQMPKDLTANRLLKSVDGVKWDGKAKAFTVQLTSPDHLYDFNQTLDAIGQHLDNTKAYTDDLAALNEQVPGLNAEVAIDADGVFNVTVRPQYDRDLISPLRTGLGATWDTAAKTWKVPIDPGRLKDLAASAGFQPVKERLAAIALSADTARNVENAHPLIAATRRGATINVMLPRDLNANEALKRAGFEWNRTLSSWTVQPKDDAHLSAINVALVRAGRELDTAMVPHTPDRPGIPRINDYFASILEDGRAAAVEKYATDRRVRSAVDAVVSGFETLPDAAKAALAAANEARAASGTSLTSAHAVPFAEAVGLEPQRAVAVIALINSAADIQAKGIPAQEHIQRVAAESQAQSQSR